MIDNVKEQVSLLLNNDNSGHGMDHINRVLEMSLKFAEEENINKDIVSLIALLHDVDDHKLFGIENAENLTNTKRILNTCNVPNDIKEKVLEEVKCIGYSKLLKGDRPKTKEGMIVSDADMCDAIGATGILRIYKYNIKHGNPFFDRNNFPIINMNYEEYTKKTTGTVVNHMFEKLLKLKGLMVTEAGFKEAEKRHQFMVDFLYQFFEEEKAYEWIEYLDNYLNKIES